MNRDLWMTINARRISIMFIYYWLILHCLHFLLDRYSCKSRLKELFIISSPHRDKAFHVHLRNQYFKTQHSILNECVYEKQTYRLPFILIMSDFDEDDESRWMHVWLGHKQLNARLWDVQILPTLLMSKCGFIDYFIEIIDPEPINPRWCVPGILITSKPYHKSGTVFFLFVGSSDTVITRSQKYLVSSRFFSPPPPPLPPQALLTMFPVYHTSPLTGISGAITRAPLMSPRVKLVLKSD